MGRFSGMQFDNFPQLPDPGLPAIGVGHFYPSLHKLGVVFSNRFIDVTDEILMAFRQINTVCKTANIIGKICGDNRFACRQIFVDF